jgi:hypothetical protein
MKSDYNISEYISKLNVEIPPEEEFKKIAQIFKIYPNESKENALVNYERGMLLYGLISKYKPKTILEIGRAQGYSTMCMAWALCENKIDGKIISVDHLSYENSIEWLIDWDGEIKTEKKSTKQIWSKYAKSDWLEKIIPLTCFSDELLEKEDLPKFDFGFIDGHHIYEGVLCDFNIFLKNSNKKFHCLFDDYIDDENARMKQAIDELLIHYPGKIIKTNFNEKAKYLGDLFMCIINDSGSDLDVKFSKEVILKYRNIRKRWSVRQKLNKMFPPLKRLNIHKIFKKI